MRDSLEGGGVDSSPLTLYTKSSKSQGGGVDRVKKGVRGLEVGKIPGATSERLRFAATTSCTWFWYSTTSKFTNYYKVPITLTAVTEKERESRAGMGGAVVQRTVAAAAVWSAATGAMSTTSRVPDEVSDTKSHHTTSS